MASNSTVLSDEDGDFEDWIEIFNKDTKAVNLSGFGLSDDEKQPLQWKFPNVTLEPGKYLLIWASGKDRKPTKDSFANGLIREVYFDIPGSSIQNLLNHPSYPNNPRLTSIVSNKFEAPTDIANNYGQRIQGWVKAPVSGNYTFWVAGDDNTELYLSTSDGPENLRRIALVPQWTTPREWTKFPEQKSASITLEAGKYYFIRALMKESSGGDNLAVGWEIPGQGLERPIDGKHLFRRSDQLHTNFKISASGESVLLSNAEGKIIDKIGEREMPSDVSYGRAPNGGSSFFYFYKSTPNSPNKEDGLKEVLLPPVFSHTSGFYTNNINLVLNTKNDNAVIVYTTDGSEPDINNLNGTTYQYRNLYPSGPFSFESFRSIRYNGPIILRDKSSEPNKLSQISTTNSTINSPLNYLPLSTIRKANVIKAKTYVNNHGSKTVTHTYFINNQNLFNHTLPVVSLSINDNELFDYIAGNYVAGIDNVNQSGIDQCGIFNWNRETEFKGSIQYFADQKNVINQNIGLALHGGCSNANPLKSFRLYARSEYDDKSSFDYSFFKNYPYSSFKRLILRNSGNDEIGTYFRDAFMQKLVEHLHFETQKYQPTVTYINGEYWGMLNLRERYDRFYMESKYGIKEGELDLLQNDGRNFANVSEGDNEHWIKLYNFINTNDMAIKANYDSVKTMMNQKSFMDYFISNIYFRNSDWPGNNIRYFRKRTTTYAPGAPYGHDGRWHWMMFDTDFGFGLYNSSFEENSMAFALRPDGPNWPNPPWSTLFLRKLIVNEEFKTDFINRYADLLNTAFLPDRAARIIDELKKPITNEMANHRARWRNRIQNWESNINQMINFSFQRPNFARNHVRQQFNIPAMRFVTLNVSDTSQGYVKINTIDILPTTPGVAPTPYPWTGSYFADIPITVTATPKRGYVFSHWSGDTMANVPTLTMVPSPGFSLTAHFKPTNVNTNPDEIICFWLIGNNITNDVPLENITSTFNKTMTSGKITFQSCLSGYPFTSSHPNWRKASMERRNKPTFLNYNPLVNNNITAENAGIRGLQIKQPFRSNGLENILNFTINTRGYENIKWSFAVADEGAASGIIIEYFDKSANVWTSRNLRITSFPLGTEYSIKEIDLSSLAISADNPDFQCRIRFDGTNMTADAGNRVTFNNFSFSGKKLSTVNQSEELLTNLNVYPNPAGNTLTVRSEDNHLVKNILLYSTNGTKMREFNNLNHTGNFDLDLSGVPSGLIILRFMMRDGRIVSKRVLKE